MARRIVRIAIVLLLAPPMLLALFVALCSLWMEWVAWGKLYDSVASMPRRDVALVLGTSHRLPGGGPNLFFEHRMLAAADLYHAGVVKHLLVSGDNRSPYYNEPRMMQRALMGLDVPSEAITLDYAGLRTLDSVVRARAIFGQDSVVIVSQSFHNKRALFLANHSGVDAIAFNAAPVRLPRGLRTRVRELFARCKAVLDVTVLRTVPRHLGEEEPIWVGSGPGD